MKNFALFVQLSSTNESTSFKTDHEEIDYEVS